MLLLVAYPGVRFFFSLVQIKGNVNVNDILDNSVLPTLWFGRELSVLGSGPKVRKHHSKSY